MGETPEGASLRVTKETMTTAESRGLRSNGDAHVRIPPLHGMLPGNCSDVSLMVFSWSEQLDLFASGGLGVLAPHAIEVRACKRPVHITRAHREPVTFTLQVFNQSGYV